MTSPSRPLTIGSPRQLPQEIEASGSRLATPTGTPDLRALRAQYAATRTPPPNIPPRNVTPTNQLRLLPSTDFSSSSRLGPSGLDGLISAHRPSTPASSNDANRIDLDDLPDEEKARVLRRHLVSREERQAGPDSDASEQEITRQSSMMFKQGGRRQDTDPFPIPYDAPGADIT
jgi:proton-coupled amino acid transporter